LANKKKYILDAATAAKKLQRMAFEILENNADETELILAGIRQNGTVIAKHIQQDLAAISNIHTEMLTISLDKNMPDEVVLSKSIDLNNKVIIVIDDVAMSGKTLLYALQPFFAAHPKKIQILVLVERSHKAFPVKPDYTGLSLATTLQEHIFVEVAGETVTGAYLE
jgi:pyrimidine operon attenuation protein/uracil phosphoribosyltransferase